MTRFDGREGDLTLDGEVVTGMLGADWSRGRWAAGLILSHSAGEGGYAGAPADASGSGTGGRVEATLTGLFPWARHTLSERLEAWGAAGYGTGELTVTPKRPGTDQGGAAIRADLDLKMAAAGLRGTLLDGGGDGLTLTGKTDALVVETASGRGTGADGGNLEPARAMVTRLRLGIEASHSLQLGNGGTILTPSMEVGLRHDGGDAETGFGLDLGAGLRLSDPTRGLEVEIRGRGLLSHESEGFRERGFLGSALLAAESDLGAGSDTNADPDARRVVLGRRRCAAVAHHAGRAGGEPRIGVPRIGVRGRRGRRQRGRVEEPAAGVEVRLWHAGLRRSFHLDAGGLDRPVGHRAGLQPRLAFGAGWVWQRRRWFARTVIRGAAERDCQ